MPVYQFKKKKTTKHRKQIKIKTNKKPPQKKKAKHLSDTVPEERNDGTASYESENY